MKYRKLGRTGPNVSALGLGCMGMSSSYGPIDDELSSRVIQMAYDRGVTFFDTADMYGQGHNEQLVGKAIAPFRDKITLATKCAIQLIDGEHVINNTPQYIKKACDASLQRLGIEVIDLYYLHRYNPDVPLQDSMGAMVDLIREGKVRQIGLSEVRSDTLEEAYRILGDRLVALQSEYSIMNFGSVKEVFPTCQKLGVSLIPYSPIGRGLLSGKICNTKMLQENTSFDFRIFLPQFQPDALSNNLQLVHALDAIAKRKGCSLAQLALAWLLAQEGDMIPIPGTKKPHYLAENLDSLEVQLSQEDLAEIEEARVQNPIQGLRYPEKFMKLFHLKS